MIAVFDLGGGTFDISIMSVDNGIFEVLATGGDTALGGEDWDRRLQERIVDEVFDQYRVDLTGIPMAMSRLREACETAKKALSVDRETTIQLPFLANDQHGAPINYERTITREHVEQLTKDLLDRLEAPCVRALADAGLAADRRRGDPARRRHDAVAGGPGRRSSGSSARSRARARTPTRSSRSAPRRTRASSPATPTTPRCSTSRRTTSASRSATRGSPS